MSECSICHTTQSKHWLMCLGGWTLCNKCAKDYGDFILQPKSELNVVILMEVYFRRGKGEEISYEELHKQKASLKFLTFEDLFDFKEKK